MFKISSANIRLKCFPAKFQQEKFYFQSQFMRFATKCRAHAGEGAAQAEGEIFAPSVPTGDIYNENVCPLRGHRLWR